MADTQSPNIKPGSGSETSDSSQQTSALSVLVDVIAELNIARKIVLIYPLDHEQVQRSVDKALKGMQKALDAGHDVSLTVINDTLFHGERELDAKNQAFKELALTFKQFKIVGITFSRGLEKEEFIRFLEGLKSGQGMDPKNEQQMNATGATMFEHIRLQSMDYSRLHLTQEEEIRRNSGQAASISTSTWRHFVADLASGGVIADCEASFSGIDPVFLAGLMNQNDSGAEKAIEHYERLVQRQLDSGVASDHTIEDTGDGLHCFNQLIQELNPLLRQQFLSVTFDQCSQSDSSEAIGGLMKGLGQEVVLQMLRFAKADGKEISPSLVALIQKIGHLPSSKKADPGADRKTHAVSAEGVQSLLNREAYEHYVDAGYDQLLKGVSMGGVGGQSLPDFGLKLDLECGLEDQQINSHTGLALMRLMAISGDVTGYRDWARQLTLMMDDLVTSESFECLSAIFSFMHEEQTGQGDEEKRKIAKLVLKSFSAPKFVSHLVLCIQKTNAELKPDAVSFMTRIGEPVVIEILDAMDGAEDAESERLQFRLLAPFGVVAAREALARLNNDNPEYICLMLRIIRSFGNPEAAEGVRTLLDHANDHISTEALATLLRFNNPWGLLRLRDIAGAQWSPAAANAIRMAGDYQVKEMVPILIALVMRRGPLHVDLERREASLRALGKIGDTACIPELKKIVKKRGTFAKKHLIQLKRTLFKSFEGYPFKSVEELLHLGLKQKDDMIQETCRLLLKKYHTQRVIPI